MLACIIIGVLPAATVGPFLDMAARAALGTAPPQAQPPSRCRWGPPLDCCHAPIPGVDLPEVQTCWTLDDARALVVGQPIGAHRMRHRRRNQPKPDQRNPIIDRRRHLTPLNCAIA